VQSVMKEEKRNSTQLALAIISSENGGKLIVWDRIARDRIE
jgi:hypothetical protein